MNIIPVLSSDKIGRVLDQRVHVPVIKIKRKKYIFYGIPEDQKDIILVPCSTITIEGKRFKSREGKLMSYNKLYALLFNGEPKSFFAACR